MNLLMALLPMVGGWKGILRLAGALLTGILLMRLYAGVVMIPAAKQAAVDALRAELAIAGAKHLGAAIKESRESRREVENATDADLRDLLNPRRVRP